MPFQSDAFFYVLYFCVIHKSCASLVGTRLAVNLDRLAATDLDCVVVAALRLLVYSQSCRC